MSLDETARGLLAAWEAGQPIRGGLAFEALLRRCQLDRSLASLERIDTLLDALRRTRKPLPQAFLKEEPQRNLVLLLAFYAGEVAGRAAGQPPRWLTYDEMIAADPSLAVPRPGFITSICCRLPGDAAGQPRFFMPLTPIATRLFRADAGHRGLRMDVMALLGRTPAAAGQPPLPGAPAAARAFAAAPAPAPFQPLATSLARAHPAALPVVQPPAGGLDIALAVPADAAARKALLMGRPDWVAEDKLRFLFDSEATLLREGRVVWAALIQANKLLFMAGGLHGGAPGEVLYDPQGRMPPAELAQVAQALLALKGQDHGKPTLGHFSDHLAGETIRVFGMDVPREASRYPLKASTTYFDRRLLPGGRIAASTFPVVLCDACPGAVLVLPQALWPAQLRQAWVPPAPATPSPLLPADDAEALFRKGQAHYDGEGAEDDPQKAHDCWLRAAAAGHTGAVKALASQYASGIGVARDVPLAIVYYREVAEQGDAAAQLEAGRLLLVRKERSYDRKEAAHWLRLAAGQGSEDAEALIAQHKLLQEPALVRLLKLGRLRQMFARAS